MQNFFVWEFVPLSHFMTPCSGMTCEFIYNIDTYFQNNLKNMFLFKILYFMQVLKQNRILN